MTTLVASHPPAFKAQVERVIMVRTQSNAAQTNVSFSYGQLAALLGIIGTSTTTSAFLTTVFKLDRVRMWGPVAVAGTPVTASITWTETSADFESPPVTQSDTSVAYDVPAFLDVKPPKGSLASKWHGSGQGSEIFALTYPTGCIVDFTFRFILNDFGGLLVGPTISGGTIGNIYHKGVNNLVPVTINAI